MGILKMEGVVMESEAREELKRADHLIFVTLKYTRTVDVIKNIIKRLINAFELATDDALVYAKKKRKIATIPMLQKLKCDMLSKVIKDERIKEYRDFYNMLKRIDRAEFSGKEEYRKHVALIVLEEGKTTDITTDMIHDFFEKTKEFVDFIEEWVSK